MQDPAETFVPIIAILVIFGLPLSYAIVNRVFAHQERLEMLRRGIVPPPDPKWAKRMSRASWCDPDAYSMPPGAAVPGYDPYAAYWASPARSLRKGLTTAMIGMALLIGLSFIDLGRPGPWLLGGLIPLFVGIAQIIVALLSGARLGPFGLGPGPGQWGPGMPPPGQQAQTPPGQQNFAGPAGTAPGGYAGWRPGPTAGLEKPPSPPDVR